MAALWHPSPDLLDIGARAQTADHARHLLFWLLAACSEFRADFGRSAERDWGRGAREGRQTHERELVTQGPAAAPPSEGDINRIDRERVRERGASGEARDRLMLGEADGRGAHPQPRPWPRPIRSWPWRGATAAQGRVGPWPGRKGGPGYRRRPADRLASLTTSPPGRPARLPCRQGPCSRAEMPQI